MTSNARLRTNVLGVTLAVGSVAAALAPAAAASGSTTEAATPTLADRSPGASAGVLASFEGRRIDLSRDWDGARSCAVVSPEDVRCYVSNEQADAALAAAGLTSNVTGETFDDQCANGWLCLFDLPNFGGRRLIFQDEGWQSLAGYGFQYKTSSWINNQACDDLGGLGDGVGGAIYISGCGARASELGDWDNRAVDVGP